MRKYKKINDLLHEPNESLSEKYLGMPTDVGACNNGTFKYLTYGIWEHIQRWIQQIFSVGEKF
jgi:hypothetical protein